MKKQPTKDELISIIENVAHKLGKTPTQKEFRRETGIGPHTAFRFFNSWNDFVKVAGLPPNPNTADRRSTEDLYEMMYSTFLKEKGIPTQRIFNKRNARSHKTYKKHWKVSTWRDILLVFKEWVEKEHPDFPYLDDLPKSESKISKKGSLCEPSQKTSSNARKRKTEGRLIGASLNFRGMETEPVNEMGVVFLFALVAEDLGFHVESIASDFPDCEAKHVVDTKGRRERVKIEFEFESRNYDHPPTCDYIVCWEHNWNECPENIEVIELREEIKKLGKDQK